MFGRIITSIAGGAIARQVGGAAAGPIGVAAGAVLPMLLRRLGPVGMIGVAIGGFVVKRVVDRERARADAAAVR